MFLNLLIRLSYAFLFVCYLHATPPGGVGVEWCRLMHLTIVKFQRELMQALFSTNVFINVWDWKSLRGLPNRDKYTFLLIHKS